MSRITGIPPAATTPMVRTEQSAIIITIPCRKSVALSARNPPRNVYRITMIAPMIMTIWYCMPNNVLNSFQKVTKQLPAYTAKNTRMNSEAIVRMIFLFSLYRLLKNSGIVIALPARVEYLRSLLATKSQFM